MGKRTAGKPPPQEIDQITRLFAEATAIVEDIHDITVRGQLANQSPKSYRDTARDLKVGNARLTRLSLRILGSVSV
ncbi:MAG: hypothetical protein GWP02_08795 [Desulfobulbaceae bacterium]|nr:hypothetical protein [Desulfobulbaceae bacterium]